MKLISTSLAPSVLLLSLLATIVFVYTPGLDGPFVLDDAANIPQTKIDDLSVSSISDVAFDNTSGIFGRPIPVATFALNHYFGDGTSHAFKVTNLAIHVLNTLLVYIFSTIVIPKIFSRFSIIDKNNTLFAALAISAIWALHPIQVSTVMYSVQRMTMLMTTFTLLAMITYIQARAASHNRPIASSCLLLGTGLFTILACLSKENGVLIVLYIGLLEILIRKCSLDTSTSRSERLFSNSILVFITLSLIIGTSLFIYKFDQFMTAYQIRDFTLTERIGTEANILILYLKNIIFPNISNMNLYLDDFQISGIISVDSLKSYFILSILLALAVACYQFNPLITFGVVFFFLSHSLESTIIPLELAFEHRNYTGTIGLSIAVVAAMTQIFRKLKIERFNYTVATFALLLISFQSYSRNLEWGDDLILNTMAVENNPRSGRAKLSLAVSLLSRSRLSEAVNLFEAASSENTKDAHTYLHLMQFKAYGGIFSQEDYDKSKELLINRPITNDVVMALDDILTNVINEIYENPDIKQVSELLRIATNNKNLALLKQNKTALFARYSLSLSLQDKNEAALTPLQIALEISPDDIDIIIMMAEEYAALHQRENIKSTLIRIPSDTRVTAKQFRKIESLTSIANDSNDESVETARSPD